MSLDDANTFDFEANLIPLTNIGVLTLGRNQDRFTRAYLDRSLTKAELRQFKIGTHRIFVFGKITYTDAFDRPRFTNYCYAIAHWGKRATASWETVLRHNESN